MTTNVYDRESGFLTSDSRWSFRTGFGVLYVDDTGFDKIEEARGNAFLFAGDSHVIQLLKDWLRADPISAAGRPTQEGIAVLIAQTATRALIYHYGQDIMWEANGDWTQSFAGSGAMYAAPCWTQNKCAHRAVDSAKTHDQFSGGEVKFFELSSGSHNLKNDIEVTALGKAFLGKGMVMYKANSNPIPVQEALKTDPRVAQICDEIASGQRSLSAPCDAMYNKPTKQDDLRLNAALDRIFG